MGSSGKQGRRGGTLSRSETVTLRLDPKLNYLCELAARAQRRTKSSLIEAALVGALNSIPVDSRPSGEAPKSIAQMAEALWDVDEVARFQRLAGLAPHLMTYEEQRIWSTLCKFPHFWFGDWREWDQLTLFFNYRPAAETMWVQQVQEYWDLIKAVAEGKADAGVLPKMEVLRLKQEVVDD